MSTQVEPLQVDGTNMRASGAGNEEFLFQAIPLAAATKLLVNTCHGAAAKAGWWANGRIDNPLCFSNALCLIHSEVSEAMEGDRKNLMDTHLPHRTSREVELADAAIRIFDLAGAYKMDLGGAIAEKLAYNANRADHKPENRAKAGGKSY